MSEDEKHIIEQYRKVNRRRQGQMQRFAGEEEIGMMKLPAFWRQWIYERPAAMGVYVFLMGCWGWLGMAPFSVHFSLRVGLVMFSLLVFMPTHAGSMVISFGGSLAMNLIYAAVRRMGMPGGGWLIMIMGASSTFLLGMLGWIVILSGRMFWTGLKVVLHGKAMEYVNYRYLGAGLLGLGLTLGFMWLEMQMASDGLPSMLTVVLGGCAAMLYAVLAEKIFRRALESVAVGRGMV